MYYCIALDAALCVGVGMIVDTRINLNHIGHMTEKEFLGREQQEKINRHIGCRYHQPHRKIKGGSMTIDELEKAWNAEPRENAWDELGLDEIVAFALEMERERCIGISTRKNQMFTSNGETYYHGWIDAVLWYRKLIRKGK